MISAAPAHDLVTHVARFAAALRAQGLAVGLHEEMDGTDALTHLDLLNRDAVRWGVRSAFRVRRRDWDLFDRTFDRLWSRRQGSDHPPVDDPLVPPEPHRPSGRTLGSHRTPLVTRVAEREVAEGAAPGFSPDAQLRRKPFDRCTAQDLVAMERLLRRMPPPGLPTRRSRRLVPVPARGAVDLRRSLRRAVGTCGDVLSLARRAHPLEEPRYVVLCDTSGSMDPHARFLLAFLLSLRRVVKRVEVFVFNTSLTRLTPFLSSGRLHARLERLAAEVPDWSGGTRIGGCLADFAARYLEAVVDARTDVVILSDGLDGGDPAVLAQALGAIRRRARRVTWLNPLLGDERYRPEARGMAAALPFLDRFAPAHNLESLERAFARAAS
ncbi:MAG: VWA domain-containing protein [Gemmatimonadetes bacterium]|nr:VWA domain-containing protein [Gemmatimonadota bacterium]